MSNCRWTPRPWQAGHAPSGELKENTLGLSSGINAPWSGQAKSSDQVVIVPCSIVIARVPSLSSSAFSGDSRDSIATVPEPIFRAVSTASVSLCLRSRVRRKRSQRTSMSWRKFLSKVGGVSNSASCPFTFP